MSGRIVGAVVALFGAGLLAVVLNDGGSEPSAAYSRWEGFLLILGTSLCISGIFLCLGGILYAVKAQINSATEAPLPAPSHALGARPAGRATGLARDDSTETVTIVCAVCISLALGGVIGLWIMSWRPSSASAVATPAPAPPVAQAPAAPTNEAPAEAAPALAASPEAPSAREEMTAAEPREDDKKRDERPDAALAAEREDKLSTTKARAERAATEPAVRGRALPCTLAASPGALTLRGGGAGAVTLRLDETAGSARVSPSTAHWADIAVFAEQQAVGGRARYTVRSVSKRPGVYSVTFRTNCGSRTVPVTVTQP